MEYVTYLNFIIIIIIFIKKKFFFINRWHFIIEEWEKLEAIASNALL